MLRVERTTWSLSSGSPSLDFGGSGKYVDLNAIEDCRIGGGVGRVISPQRRAGENELRVLGARANSDFPVVKSESRNRYEFVEHQEAELEESDNS